MRRFTILLVGALAVASAGFARFDANHALELAKKYHLGWKDAVSIDSMGRQFGVSADELAKARVNHHINNNDLANGLYFSRASSQDRNYIYKLRASGMGWGQIAHQLGVHPGTFNKQRVQWMKDSEVNDDIARYRLQRNYAMTAADFDWARKHQMDWDDMVAANQLARERNMRFRDVATRYSKARNWDSVRNQSMRAGGAYDPRFDTYPKNRPLVNNPRRPIIFYGRSHETKLQRLIREREQQKRFEKRAPETKLQRMIRERKMKERFAKKPPETKLQKMIRERKNNQPAPTARFAKGRPSPPPRLSKGNTHGPAKGLGPRKLKGKGGSF